MMHFFAMIFGLFAFVAPVICSEKNTVEIFAKANSGFMQLRCASKKSIDRLKEFDINVDYNSPCFAGCEYSSKDFRTRINESVDNQDGWIGMTRKDGSEITLDDIEKQKQELKGNKKFAGITAMFDALRDEHFNKPIPWQCFVNNNNTSRYKTKGATLFQFARDIEGENIIFTVKSGTSFGDRDPQDDIDLFYKDPRYCLDTDKKELIDAGILVEEKGKLKHGPKGYFKTEKSSHQHTKKSVHSYSWFRDCFCIVAPIAALISTPFIILYVLNKNFYTTAS